MHTSLCSMLPNWDKLRPCETLVTPMRLSFLHTSTYSIYLYSGPQCNKPLGMQNGRIRATQITASSSWDKNHSPNNGRLFFQRSGARMGAWCARHNNRYQWLAVDFGRAMRVVKFATQGRHDARQWVTQYYLSSSQDNVYFAEYKQNSGRKVRRQVQCKFKKRKDVN